MMSHQLAPPTLSKWKYLMRYEVVQFYEDEQMCDHINFEYIFHFKYIHACMYASSKTHCTYNYENFCQHFQQTGQHSGLQEGNVQQTRSSPIHTIRTTPSHYSNNTKKAQSAPLEPLLSFSPVGTTATMQQVIQHPMKRPVNGMYIVYDHVLYPCVCVRNIHPYIHI